MLSVCCISKGAGEDSQVALCELGLPGTTKTNPKAW